MFLLEIIFEIIFEGLLQLIVEIVLEVLGHAFSWRTQENRTLHAAVVFIFYGAVGAALGGASLLIFPRTLVRPSPLPGASLIISPLLVGLAMSLIGRWRLEHGQKVLRLDSFAYGAIFAFGFALIRFQFAT
jgi:hypothetical protein